MNSENEKLRGLLQQALDMLEEQALHIEAEMQPAGKKLLNQIRAALSQQADQNPAKQQPQWISVEERLPSIAQEVIVNTDFEGVCAGVLDSYMEWYAPCSDYKLTRVTHWLPLPTPPTP